MTDLKNTSEAYGAVAKFFHWSIAFLIMGLLPVGLFMTGMENSPFKFDVYAMHKSFGLLVFFLGLVRIAWRFISPPPQSFPGHKKWERALAGASHLWLYVCVIGMPLSGWLMSSAGEFPIPFFGAQLPPLIGKNEGLAETFVRVHEVLAYTLLFVLGLHIAGALKHHVIDKDRTLMRMAFVRKPLVMAVTVVIVAGLSFTLCGVLLAKDFLSEQDEHEAPPQEQSVSGAALPAVADGWTIVREESRLSFETSLYGAPLTGEFKNFSGTIVFDPYDLAAAMADIRIDLASAETGDTSRDQTMEEEPWFDVARHPEARFVSASFEKTGANAYVAKGDLIIRDEIVPVLLPFTLEISGDIAHMTAATTLNRLDFGIGTGEWEDDKTVGHKVVVSIDLKAKR